MQVILSNHWNDFTSTYNTFGTLFTYDFLWTKWLILINVWTDFNFTQSTCGQFHRLNIWFWVMLQNFNSIHFSFWSICRWIGTHIDHIWIPWAKQAILRKVLELFILTHFHKFWSINAYNDHISLPMGQSSNYGTHLWNGKNCKLKSLCEYICDPMEACIHGRVHYGQYK